MNIQISTFIPEVLCAISTLGICFAARPVGNWLQVFDYPRGGRKQHAEPTPMIGGLAIFAPVAVWLAWTVMLGGHTQFLLAVLLSGTGVVTMGIMDDQAHLAPGGRILMVVVFSIIALVIDPGLLTTQLHWASLGTTHLPSWAFGVLFTMSLAGFTSSVNMADGIDGVVLASLLLWCLGFDVFAHGDVRTLSFILSGPVLVALVFNLRGKLFLGDGGAFGLSFIVGLMAVMAHNTSALYLDTVLVWFALPVIDCLRLIAARLAAGRSPLSGGKDHFHHLLAEIFGKRQTLAIYALTMGVTGVGAALVPVTGLYMLVAIFALCVGFVAARRVLFTSRNKPISPRVPRR